MNKMATKMHQILFFKSPVLSITLEVFPVDETLDARLDYVWRRHESARELTSHLAKQNKTHTRQKDREKSGKGEKKVKTGAKREVPFHQPIKTTC